MYKNFGRFCPDPSGQRRKSTIEKRGNRYATQQLSNRLISLFFLPLVYFLHGSLTERTQRVLHKKQKKSRISRKREKYLWAPWTIHGGSGNPHSAIQIIAKHTAILCALWFKNASWRVLLRKRIQFSITKVGSFASKWLQEQTSSCLNIEGTWGNDIRMLTPERELEKKNLSLYNFVYVNSTQKGDQTKDFFHLAPLSMTPVVHLEMQYLSANFRKISKRL